MKKLLLATAAACALAGGIALFSGCVEETYEVTFLPAGGQLSTEQTTIEVSAGEAIEALPDAEKFGYEFLGWYDGDILAGQVGQSYTPDESVELTAKWNEVESDYTVRYVLNAENTTDLYTYPADSASGTAAFNGTVTVTGMPSEAYISAAPTAPTREGYHFAGWHTEADIGEEDIVHGVSKYLWMFGEKLSVTGKSKLESMSDELIEQRQISEEVMLIDSADDNGTLTLYARWVKEKEISDEEGLKSIADDLYGAYILTDDITLTDDWDMIGAYYGFYFLEFADYYTKEFNDEREMLKLLYQTMRALINPHIPDQLIRYIFELKALTINGQGPQVFQCITCGNKDRPAVFSAQKGGLVCSDCGADVKDGIILDNSTLFCMQFIESSRIEKLYTFNVTEQVLAQLGTVMKRLMDLYVDKKFKSLEILETLLR